MKNKVIKNKKIIISVTVLLTIALMAIFSDFICEFPYDFQNIEFRLLTPNNVYKMGTDSLGRDLFSRILFGAKISMAVGILTALFSLVIGGTVGSISGFFGGWIDSFLMRVVDLFFIFPTLLLAILIMLIFSNSFIGILLALSLTGWMNIARLVRAQILKLKQMTFIESARASGQSELKILLKHLLPHTVGIVIVALTYQIPQHILTESFLSFMGIGIQPPLASWGSLANEGWRGMRSYPHLILFPGIFLFLSLFFFQVLGDGLRDLLDPKTELDSR